MKPARIRARRAARSGGCRAGRGEAGAIVIGRRRIWAARPDGWGAARLLPPYTLIAALAALVGGLSFWLPAGADAPR
jgi:hypothetical protein